MISGERIDSGRGVDSMRGGEVPEGQGQGLGSAPSTPTSSYSGASFSLSRLRRRVTSQDDGMQLGAGTPSAVAAEKVQAGVGGVPAARSGDSTVGVGEEGEAGDGRGTPVPMGGSAASPGQGARRPTPSGGR